MRRKAKAQAECVLGFGLRVKRETAQGVPKNGDIIRPYTVPLGLTHDAEAI